MLPCGYELLQAIKAIMSNDRCMTIGIMSSALVIFAIHCGSYPRHPLWTTTLNCVMMINITI